MHIYISIQSESTLHRLRAGGRCWAEPRSVRVCLLGGGLLLRGAGRGAGLLLRPHPPPPPGQVTQSEWFLLSLPTLCCPGPCLISFYMQILMLSPTVPLTALCRCYDVTPPTPNPLPHLPVQKALLFLFWIAKPGDWHFRCSDTVFPISILIYIQSAALSFQNSLHGPRTHRIMSHALRAVRGH